MHSNERKARVRVFGDETGRLPYVLIVAFRALESDAALVRIHMTATAAAIDVDLDRSTVVVTAKAGRFSVGAFEREPRLGEVVKREVFL